MKANGSFKYFRGRGIVLIPEFRKKAIFGWKKQGVGSGSSFTPQGIGVGGDMVCYLFNLTLLLHHLN